MSEPTVGWAVLLGMLALGPVRAETPPETVTLTGEVVMLTAALKPLKIAFDAGPIAQQIVIRAEDGALTPLLSDDASRALFVDDRLRNRATEIKARRFPGIPYVQVVSIRVADHGQLRTPEYYCEICTISVRFPQTCPCCQGPMELRMRPESR